MLRRGQLFLTYGSSVCPLISSDNNLYILSEISSLVSFWIDLICCGVESYTLSGEMNSSGVVAVLLNDVEEGTYTACAMIDMGDDGVDLGPESGDYVTDTVLNIPDDGEFITVSSWDSF